MLEEMTDEDLSERYVERLSVLTEITKVLEYTAKNILRIQNEITKLQEELVIRGFTIKEIDEDAKPSE
jgi:hypothetical protein